MELDHDTLSRVFEWLDARSLCCCEAVCKAWRGLVDSEDCDTAWFNCCVDLWQGKAGLMLPRFKKEDVVPTNIKLLFPGIRLTTEAVNGLSVRDLKTVLSLRRVDFQGFLEKSDFRNAFISSTPSQIMGWSTPFRNKWKASFVYSLRDSKREAISPRELMEITWNFSFKQKFLNKTFKFLKGGKVETNMDHVADSYWHIFSFDEGTKRGIQVDDYPFLTARRRPDDWGWMLENAHVVFFSEDYGCESPEVLFNRYKFHQ